MNSLFINETALHTRLLHPPFLPLLSLLQAGVGGGGVAGVTADFGRLPPEAPGSTSRVFCFGTLWPQLINVRDQSASVRRGAQLRKSLPRQRSNSSDDKLAGRSEQSSELPREGCFWPGQASLPAPGERSPGLVFPSISPR